MTSTSLPVTVALAGNPNVGKSTIFNALTGSRQHVGNWPGKTVEKKEGHMRAGDRDVLVVDLPGAYSLTAYSVEEVIARDFIVDARPEAVVAVVDASNLERNLYLVAQLLELETPLIVVLNMSDVAGDRGLAIDAARLSAELGAPVVSMVGNRRVGIEALRRAIAQVAGDATPPQSRLAYGGVLQVELDGLEALIQTANVVGPYRPRWLAVKLLENDPAVNAALQARGAMTLLDAAAAAQARVEAAAGDDAETLIADRRYAFIGQVIDRVVTQPAETAVTRSDRIDAIVTHRVWGLPIFLLTMWVVFQFTAKVSAPLLDWIDGFINRAVYGWAESLLAALGLGGTWVDSLVTDGIIAGVGGVLVFVPVLLFLYMSLAVLEDSGYMARAAFVMDRVMRAVGLHGKSFLPMIVGFGCTVPAIYATRTLENEHDRRLTALVATFMSCGARLPVYVIFGAAFFGALSGNLIFGLYLLGIGVALLTGFALKHTVYRGLPPAPFVMELPPYRAPRPADVWRQMWRRTRSFLMKAGTVILGVSVVMWLLMATPGRAGAGSFNDVAPEDSIFGVVSGVIAPVFEPAGFGTWEASGSLLTGVLAKEVIVSTLSQAYAGGDAAPVETAAPVAFGRDLLTAALDLLKALALTIQEVINIVPRTLSALPGIELGQLSFFSDEATAEDTSRLESALVASFTASAGSPARGALAAVAFTVFVLLYVPCMAATAAMRQEFGPRWMAVQVGFTLLVAWLAAVLVFQLGQHLI